MNNFLNNYPLHLMPFLLNSQKVKSLLMKMNSLKKTLLMKIILKMVFKLIHNLNHKINHNFNKLIKKKPKILLNNNHPKLFQIINNDYNSFLFFSIKK
jgi:hypothetical protein